MPTQRLTIFLLRDIADLGDALAGRPGQDDRGQRPDPGIRADRALLLQEVVFSETGMGDIPRSCGR